MSGGGEVERVADFIDEIFSSMGVTISIPSEKLARTMYAASDGIAMLTLLEPDAEELFEPFVDLVIRGLSTMIAEASPAPEPSD